MQSLRFGSFQGLLCCSERITLESSKFTNVKQMAGLCFSSMVKESGFPLLSSSLVGMLLCFGSVLVISSFQGVAYDEKEDMCAAWSYKRLIWSKGLFLLPFLYLLLLSFF